MRVHGHVCKITVSTDPSTVAFQSINTYSVPFFIQDNRKNYDATRAKNPNSVRPSIEGTYNLYYRYNKVLHDKYTMYDTISLFIFRSRQLKSYSPVR